jgi:type VI secretion system FHA domain protein
MIKITVLSYSNEVPAQALFAIFDHVGGTIGRTEDNYFVLPDPRRFVSRTQARVKSDGTRHTIVNLSSANPIFINGQELGPENEYDLKVGDTIQVGLYLMRAEAHAMPEDNPASDQTIIVMQPKTLIPPPQPIPQAAPVPQPAATPTPVITADPLNLNLAGNGLSASPASSGADPFADLLGGATPMPTSVSPLQQTAVPRQPPVPVPVEAKKMPQPSDGIGDLLHGLGAGAPVQPVHPVAVPATANLPQVKPPAATPLPPAVNAAPDLAGFDDILAGLSPQSGMPQNQEMAKPAQASNSIASEQPRHQAPEPVIGNPAASSPAGNAAPNLAAFDDILSGLSMPQSGTAQKQPTVKPAPTGNLQGFDDLLVGLPQNPLQPQPVPAAVQQPLPNNLPGFDDLLVGLPGTPAPAVATAAIKPQDNPFGFEDLLQSSTHNDTGLQGYATAASAIPDDFDPFALPSQSSRNAIDPLTGLPSNETTLESLEGHKADNNSLMPSSLSDIPASSLLLEPATELGAMERSSADPMALFATEKVLPQHQPDQFDAFATSNHVPEVNAHFVMPEVKASQPAEAVQTGNSDPDPFGMLGAPLGSSAAQIGAIPDPFAIPAAHPFSAATTPVSQPAIVEAQIPSGFTGTAGLQHDLSGVQVENPATSVLPQPVGLQATEFVPIKENPPIIPADLRIDVPPKAEKAASSFSDASQASVQATPPASHVHAEGHKPVAGWQPAATAPAGLAAGHFEWTPQPVVPIEEKPALQASQAVPIPAAMIATAASMATMPAIPVAPTQPAVPSAPENAAGAAPVPDTQALLQALLDGAGIPEFALGSGLTPELMNTVGKLLAATVQGTIELMASRALIKREVKADITMIVVSDNNPLKFLPDSQTVLMQMLRKKMPGFMGPVEAMQDAFQDLRAHQIGVVSGMKAALDEAMTRFNPQQLEERLKKHALLDTVIPQHRKAKMWDLYNELFNDIHAEAQDNFQAIFGKAFLAAYQEQIRRFNSEQ